MRVCSLTSGDSRTYSLRPCPELIASWVLIPATQTIPTTTQPILSRSRGHSIATAPTGRPAE